MIETTKAGLAADGNLESVDVFVSWEDGRDRQRVQQEVSYFEKLWANQYGAARVRPIPDVARSELVRVADPAELESLIDRLCQRLDASDTASTVHQPMRRVLRTHQAEALDRWRAMGRRGILQHATGSGKTLTALHAIREALHAGETPIVVVPSELLLKQWREEIRLETDDLGASLVVCGGGNSRWREDGLVSAATRLGGNPCIVLSTMQTASGEDFLASVRQGRHILIVADEVHRCGSPEHRRILSLGTGPRLGLSATPERYGDPLGTQALLAYFGGVVEPPFTLQDAIRAGLLTPYFYHVHQVALDPDEQRSWDALSRRIVALMRGAKARAGGTPVDESRLRSLSIQRASLLKHARRKVGVAARVITEHYHEGEMWIVYCDSQEQVGDVLAVMRSTGVNALEYHTGMSGDRSETLRYFRDHGGVLVSIRCLDEGVDIPAITHALILASSKNPREYIQRRGRVLRRAPGKAVAHVHDALVMPAEVDEYPRLSIVASELARALHFAEGAANPSAATDLRRIAVQQGLDTDDVGQGGFEEDNDAE